uniref:non-specific serine/threonine protein kinase n=1 Tax=Nothobranchius korthausae TaxID=1143690 RepID=A0A1A8FPY8_9TELE
MKNLVLKIIRGSFPPVSVHYSQELRSLLAQLFKRNPRERPSVSSVLDKPFLFCRIEKFLTPQIIAQEFRHNFLHKQPKVGLAQVPSAQKITKPASKYGVPLTGAKRPSEKKSAVKHKPEGIRKRKMEQMERERKQKEQLFLLKAEQMKRYEKEKISRINQAREQGWKHVLGSSGGSSPERKCFMGGKRAAGVVAVVLGSHLAPAPAPIPNKRPYEHYHAALDQTAKSQPKDSSRDGASAGPGSPVRGVVAAAGPVLSNSPTQCLNHDVIRRELQKLQHASKQAHISRLGRAQMAAERTFQVKEFLQRKKEAMRNKVRAEGQLGTRPHLAAIYGSWASTARCRRPKVNREEEEYLARLRQIRLQNFNERQQIKARLRGEKYDSDGSDSQESSEEAELRRKKIEVLKAQANTRAAVLKEQLEKKRQEAFEREKRAWEDHLAAARGVKLGIAAEASPVSDLQPPEPWDPQREHTAKPSVLPAAQPSSSAISMTAALKNVGAITPLKESLHEPETTAAIQSEKKQILNRLNQNLKALNPVDKMESPPPPAPAEPSPDVQQKQSEAEKSPTLDGDGKKWEAAKLPALPEPPQMLEETNPTTDTSSEDRPSSVGDRKKWEAGTPLVFPAAQQTLEETCITTIDQTVGEVIMMGELEAEAPRKVWGASPVCQVLRVLQEAKLQSLTQQLDFATVSDNTFSVSAASDDGKMTIAAPTSAVDQNLTADQHVSVTNDAEDLESVVLEEMAAQASDPPAKVQQAWGPKAQMPPEGATRPTGSTEVEKSADKPESSTSAQHEEPLFTKCSPAHRRTAALAILSAQSSLDDSSSSLGSRSRSVSPLRSKNQKALLIGLSTGMFDANNPKMLRTCSLPDLSRPFSCQQDSVTNKANAAPDKDLEIEDLEEATKEDDQSEAEDAYEDEDLRDIRASMERLLQDDSDITKSPPDVEAGDFNGNPPEVRDQELFNRITAEIDQDHSQMAVDEEEEEDDDDEDEEEEEDDDEEECSNESPGDEEGRELLSNGVGGEHHSDDKQLNEEWHSDGSGEDQVSEADHHDSIFSRLEELRFDLEQQMGFEKFIEAYNKIKAIHEDEDESIELGSSLVSNILGTEHQHLYPNILHLVMADGAYQEDNNE